MQVFLLYLYVANGELQNTSNSRVVARYSMSIFTRIEIDIEFSDTSVVNLLVPPFNAK